jgi:hypothetical protein
MAIESWSHDTHPTSSGKQKSSRGCFLLSPRISHSHKRVSSLDVKTTERICVEAYIRFFFSVSPCESANDAASR